MGTYKPTVTTAVKQQFTAKETLENKLDAEFRSELAHDWENVEDLIIPSVTLDVNTDEIEADTGDIPVRNFGETEEDAVVKNLEGICVKLSQALKLRLKLIPIVKATLNAFSNDFIKSYNEDQFNNPTQLSTLKE